MPGIRDGALEVAHRHIEVRVDLAARAAVGTAALHGGEMRQALAGAVDVAIEEFQKADAEVSVPRAPNVFDALEKLGLHLEKSKAPREFIFIEHIERPSENEPPGLPSPFPRARHGVGISPAIAKLGDS